MYYRPSDILTVCRTGAPGDLVEVEGTIRCLGGMLRHRPWMELQAGQILRVTFPPYRPAHWRLQKTIVGRSLTVRGKLVTVAPAIRELGHRVELQLHRFVDRGVTALQWARRWGACQEAVEWLEQHPDRDLDQAWRECPRLAWLLWALQRLDPPQELLQQLHRDFGYSGDHVPITIAAQLMAFNGDRTGAEAVQVTRHRLPRVSGLPS